MSVQTILVHLASDADHMGRLRVAYGLARRLDARVIALYVTTPVGMPVAVEGRGASLRFLREAEEIARDKAKAVEAEFRRWCQEQNVTYEWITANGDHLSLLARHAIYADLAVVSQSSPRSLEEVVYDHLPDRLPFAAPCPTLVVPRGFDVVDVGQRILLAWKETREASRAIRDALPFLLAADQVRLLGVKEGAEDNTLPLAQAWLRHHGVEADTRWVERRGRLGDIFMEEAKAGSYDMVVMGGYGHSRLRELVLGGATYEMLTRARLPVLMSH